MKGNVMSRNFGLVPHDVRQETQGDWPHLDAGPLDNRDHDANRDFRRLVGVVAACAVVLGIIVLLWLGSMLIAAQVQARDDGRYANSPLHAWFDQLASGKGLCCSFADGVSIADVDWDTDGAGGHYRVRLNGHWVDVPDAAVVTEPNRDGRAFVWPYMDAEGNRQIRCFLPGAGA